MAIVLISLFLSGGWVILVLPFALFERPKPPTPEPGPEYFDSPPRDPSAWDWGD